MKALFEFVAENQKEFYLMQKIVTVEGNRKIVDILWEFLN